MNNPLEHNRFDLRFCAAIKEQIKKANNLPLVKLIVLRGGGTRAFSHGINHFDILNAVEQNDTFLPIRLFREMYKLAFYISNISTPVMTMINGSMISGGAGIGAYADYTVATPGSVFSAPDCSFGFFPDNGNCFLLSRVDQKFPGMGTFLALTGASLAADDLIHAGIATHFGFPGMEVLAMEGLPSLPGHTKQRIHENILEHLSAKGELAPPTFTRDLAPFKRCFHEKKSVESIIEALKAENSEWAKNTLLALSKNSPTSLKVTLKAMNEAHTLELNSVYTNDYRIALRMIHTHDFKEGVSKGLKSKSTPKWSPATLEEVSDEYVDSFFEPLSLDKENTCDLVLPDEAFMGDIMKSEVKRLKF
jgi:enoyl-CoA hydratase/carnithine racemase